MSTIVTSKHGIRIRLPEERWSHIVEGHPELVKMQAAVLNTVEDPQRILAGKDDELLAVREVESGKHLVVVYRELEEDGFIITAFITRRVKSLEKRAQRWP